MKDIYELKLHESASIEVISSAEFNSPQRIRMIRVPGGWIYKIGPYDSPVFVPFNNEFEKK